MTKVSPPRPPSMKMLARECRFGEFRAKAAHPGGAGGPATRQGNSTKKALSQNGAWGGFPAVLIYII